MDHNNTVFDDVFRTLLEKIPRLIIPVINEVFGTAYDENTEVTQLRNEHQTKEGERITDSSLQLGNKIYHIECQSNPDSTMVIRMVEYDFYIALDHVIETEGKYRIEFPRTCVLYLRHNSGTKDELELEILFPQGNTVNYRVPVVKVQNYTKDAIFQKKLFFLLPFYVMRYEKEAELLEEDEEKLKKLLEEYEEIRIRLEKCFREEEKERDYAELKELILRISDYIFRENDKAKKGVGACMGGKVLELEVDKLWDKKEAEMAQKQAVLERQQAALERQQEALEQQQAALERQQAAMDQQQEAMDQQQEAMDQQQEAMDQQQVAMLRQKEEMSRQQEDYKEKARIQTLYSIAGFSPKQIAEKLNCTLDRVREILAS